MEHMFEHVGTRAVGPCSMGLAAFDAGCSVVLKSGVVTCLNLPLTPFPSCPCLPMDLRAPCVASHPHPFHWVRSGWPPLFVQMEIPQADRKSVGDE